MIKQTAYPAFIALLLASCATVITTPDELTQNSSLPSGRYYLPRTMFNIKVAVDKDTKTSGIYLAKTVEPDPRVPLRFTSNLSAISSDVIEVNTDEAGLLLTVSSDTEDQSGQIAIKLASLVFTSMTGGASAPERSLPSDTLTTSYTFGASYDPLDPVQTSKVRNKLAEANFCVLVGDETNTTDVGKTCSQSLGQTSSYARQLDYTKSMGGIYYRVARPTPVAVYRRTAQGQAWTTLWMGNEQVFDQSSLYQIQINRTAFVKKEYAITFQNGSLTKLLVKKPSEVLAGLAIPITIAKIIFTIPLAGLQKNEELLKAETARANAEAGYINAQKSLIPLRIEAAKSGISIPGSERSLALHETIVTAEAISECQERYASATAEDCRARLNGE